MITIMLTALQTAVNDSLDKKHSPRERKEFLPAKSQSTSKGDALLFSATIFFPPLLHYKIHDVCFITEAKIQLEQYSRTACVAVLHSLAIET